MGGKPVLGRLERIRDIREYWAGEALDFTPWLASADNITLLSEAIDIDLEGHRPGKECRAVSG